MCRTLIIFYILFRPGHLLSTGRLFFLMQSSGQDAYLGTPFIRYRRVPNCEWKNYRTFLQIFSVLRNSYERTGIFDSF